MSTPRNPLAGLLRLRGIERDRAAQQLAEQARRQAALQQRAGELRQSLGLQPVETGDAASLHAIAAARAVANRLLSELDSLQQLQRQATDAAESAHRLAHQRHRGIERLDERRAAHASQLDQQREQAALDEHAGTAWLRSAGS